MVQGFTKRFQSRRVPRYWVPQLFKSVVYSEVLDKYLRTIVTDRALELIHQNYGFDHYLLKVILQNLKIVLVHIFLNNQFCFARQEHAI